MELKQLRYFVVCAEAQSFRRAAGILYTTQPNVSKVIRALEDELGQKLFERTSLGAVLTENGKKIYEYACATLKSAEHIQNFSEQSVKTELRILTNPSSWMAHTFCHYYQKFRSDKVSYTFLSAGTHEIINSLGNSAAGIAFVYMMEQQLPFLEQQLSGKHLAFAELKRMKAMLYTCRKGPENWKSAEREYTLPLIQGFEDEFTLRSFLYASGYAGAKIPAFKVAVTTNSDYLMSEMLKNTELGNISCEYLNESEQKTPVSAISLYDEETPVLFGCIFRNDRPLKNEEKNFLNYVRKEMIGEPDKDGTINA